MTDTPTELLPEPPGQPPAPQEQARAASGSKRVWWIVAALLVVVALLVWAVLSLALRGPTAAPGPSSTPSDSASPTPSATPTETSSPTPSETAPAEEDPTPTAEEINHFNGSLTTGNTAALEQNFADEVLVIIAASECCGPSTPAEAIPALDYVEPGSGATWDFALSEATLDSYRAGFYVDYFPEHAIVGLSTDGYVVSFIRNSDRLVEVMFMAIEEVLLF